MKFGKLLFKIKVGETAKLQLFVQNTMTSGCVKIQ